MRGNVDTGGTINWEIADGSTGQARSTICDKTYANAFRFEFISNITQNWGILQFIEPQEAKSFNGKTMTISFVSNLNHDDWFIYLQASGDSAHIFSLSSTTTNPYGSTGYVVSGSVTIPDDTFNDGDNTIALYFYNTADRASGDTVDVSLIQLEEGTVRTPYEFRTYADDLALCQRYLYVMNVASNQNFARFGIGLANSNVEAQAIVNFPVTMRIPPTALEGVSSGLYQASDGSTGHAGTNLTLTGNVRTNNTACISLATTGLTSKNPYYVEANGNAAGTKYLRFSAEL